MISTYTYRQPFYPDSLTFEMSKESGRIYTKALLLNKKEHKKFKEIEEIMQEYCKNNTKYLQSQSAQASYQSFIVNLKAYFKSLKEFKKNPKKFSGEPKPPRKSKFLYKITFKKSAIRRKDNELLLSVKKPHEPIKIKWAKHLPIPTWVIISYDRFEGWNINFVMEKECKELSLDKNKFMSMDLGNKRIAATFNTVDNKVKTYSGKKVISLVRLRNIVDSRIKSKKSKYKKGSRKHKKIARAGRRIVKRIKNQQKDILHKYSRMIVNDATSKNIGKIIIGNNANTHNKTNLGKENQKVQQNPEQQLAKYVEHKFNSVSGQTEFVPEPYTSRDCPKCDNRKLNSPKGRDYACDIDICNFAYDRDGVGSINIMRRNVSFDRKYWLDVVGGLTPPIGVKLKYFKDTPRLSLASNSKMIGSKHMREPVSLRRLEEPHVL